jgi:hypothetical protein
LRIFFFFFGGVGDQTRALCMQAGILPLNYNCSLDKCFWSSAFVCTFSWKWCTWGLPVIPPISSVRITFLPLHKTCHTSHLSQILVSSSLGAVFAA